jgi:hypothetical protein
MLLRAHLVNGTCIHAFPEISIRWQVPLQDFSEHHRARKHVHLVVVLEMRVPKFGRLPVDGPDEALDHKPRRLFDLGQTEVRYLGGTLLAIRMLDNLQSR